MQCGFCTPGQVMAAVADIATGGPEPMAEVGFFVRPTLLVARDWRRGVRQVAAATVVGLGLALVLVSALIDRLVALAGTPEEQAAVFRVADATVGSLSDVLLVVMLVALVLLALQLAVSLLSGSREAA